VAICSLLLIRTGQNGSSRINIKFQAWRSITTGHFILCIVFCIKWIDASILIYDRTYFWQQMISLLWWRLLALASTRSACWVKPKVHYAILSASTC